MGRKGVSKRKPKQKKAKQLLSDNTSSGISLIGRALGSQPVKSPEPDKAVPPASRGGVNQPSDSKRNPKRR